MAASWGQIRVLVQLREAQTGGAVKRYRLPSKSMGNRQKVQASVGFAFRQHGVPLSVPQMGTTREQR